MAVRKTDVSVRATLDVDQYSEVIRSLSLTRRALTLGSAGGVVGRLTITQGTLTWYPRPLARTAGIGGLTITSEDYSDILVSRARGTFGFALIRLRLANGELCLTAANHDQVWAALQASLPRVHAAPDF